MHDENAIFASSYQMKYNCMLSDACFSQSFKHL